MLGTINPEILFLQQEDQIKAGLLDILGGTGEVNVQGENVQKMDSIANRILLYRMERCGALCAMGSEEEPELVNVTEEQQVRCFYPRKEERRANLK